MKINPLHATDFYKTGHIFQYPSDTRMVYSNFTCRADKFALVLPGFDHKVVFFGLQGVIEWLLCDLWNSGFFWRDRDEVIAEYGRRMDGSLGPGVVTTDHVAALHQLGYLPVKIKALPEGSRVDIRVPLWTIRSTHHKFGWLTNYLESQLSAECWKTITSATTAYEYRRLFDRFAVETGVHPAFVQWQGHDFSFRGMSGIFDGAQTGAGHLLSFTGTDTILAIDYLEDYYSGRDTFVGGSVPATEHSVMCMGGKDTEIDTIRRLITEVYPKGIISIVSDTWDFWQTISVHALALREVIVNREKANPGSKVVFRPDSGDPVKVVCGDPEAPDDSPQYRGAYGCLWDIFGGQNARYRHLDPCVGLIYGDSINLDRANRILAGLKAKDFSSGAMVFGIGSYTYQCVTRDTFGTAIKATYGQVGSLEHELYKDPKTDDGLKKSARGLLRVEKEADANGHDKFVLYDRQTWEQEGQGALTTVFHDGSAFGHQTLVQIRERLHPEWKLG